MKRLLDAYCGAGGCTKGYQRAGFYVVGVDIEPQPHYCGDELYQGDAVEYIREHGHEFDVISASPPCQAHSIARHIHSDYEYPDLIAATRSALLAVGKPYVIENVPGAPLVNPITLCGVTFGLMVFRHRLFETVPWMLGLSHTSHGNRRIGKDGFCCVAGHGDSGNGHVPRDHRTIAAWKRAMGIDWMTKTELTQAIPPAYTEWIGTQLLAALEVST